jgi:hypothetical protein
MRSFPSGATGAENRQRMPSEPDLPDDPEPLTLASLLFRLEALLSIALGFALAAQVLFAATH